jgi:hypothetical protein
MDANTINEIFDFLEIDFRVSEKLPCSGQREVFLAEQITTPQKCILKICSYVPVRRNKNFKESRFRLFSRFFISILHNRPNVGGFLR